MAAGVNAAGVKNGDLAARAEALSPKRLALLTGFFIIALAALLVTKLQEEVAARRIETELRVAEGATRCAGAMNVAIMTGASVRQTLADCHPGGASAVYHLSPAGDVITLFGASERVFLDATTARSLPLNERGEALLDLAEG